MDGVRAYWDGQQLWTRQGVEITAPEEFTHGLPNGISLDGELWMGRGTFEHLMSALNSNEEHKWNNIRYCVFDPPSQMKSHKERMELLQKISFPSQVEIDMCNVYVTFRSVLFP